MRPTARRPRLVVLVGPTAVGKTALAIDVSLRVGAEVLTADSMQVYRYMDIGTAKPTLEERRGVPHHGIDLVEPDEPFSVADYQSYARETIAEIGSRGRVPLLTGGTGLYVRSVTDGFVFSPGGQLAEFRQKMTRLAEEQGNERLHARLAALDPEAARRIHPNDRRRVIRALELHEQTGERPTQHLRRREDGPYEVLMMGLTTNRQTLYRQIEDRVDDQLRRGLLDEVKSLLDRGYSRSLVSMQSLGYRELSAYLAGEDSLAEAVRKLKQATRRLAKRQLSWWRRDERIRWLDLASEDALHHPGGPIAWATGAVAQAVEGFWNAP